MSQPYRQLIVRAFTVYPTALEGRTIDGRCVPYGESTTVDDGRGPYEEGFERGSFRRAVAAPQKVLLDFEHQTDPLSTVGRGVEFVERSDGLWGTFTAFETPAGDQALAMVRDGVLPGLSVRALVLGPGKRRDGVLWRTACHLDRVALVREPAYAGAVITALRSRAMPDEPEELAALRPPANPALDARLAALGVVPSRAN